MTRGIDDMLGLPPLEEIIRSQAPQIVEEEIEEVQDEEEEQEDIGTALARMQDEYESALPDISATDHSTAMDTVYEETLKHSRELMDLGFNVDQRGMATIFEKAVMMYKTAIDAKSSKRDAQFKAMKLLLDERKLKLEEEKLKNDTRTSGGDAVVETEGVVVLEDRNELVRMMRAERQQAAKAPNQKASTVKKKKKT